MSIKIALAGNPNSGKTTLFNALTGSNQFVGNWPGVTVEKKEGKLKGNKDVILTDLPGIYSLSPYTLEEVVARNYLIDQRPDAILNIIDGTNLERNLYLTTQLKELGIPMVIAVNMTDIVEKNGDTINLNELSKVLACPVVSISALKGTGIDKVAELAVKAARDKKRQASLPLYSPTVSAALGKISDMLTEVDENGRDFFAVKIFERDEKIGEKLKKRVNAEGIISVVEREMDDDSESIITNERYEYITKILKKSYKKKNKGAMTTSDKIDRIVTNRWLSLPIFAVVMFCVYYIAVTTVGTIATDWANDGVFGDGWHLFGIGAGEYEEKVEAFDIEGVKVEAYLEAAAEAGLNTENVEAQLEEEEPDEGVFTSFIDQARAAGIAATAQIEDEEGELIETYEVSAAEFEAALAAEETDPADYGVWVPGVPVLLTGALESIGTADWLISLIVDGIVGGVGAVLGFVPQMLVLFIMLAFLEGCGYMARVAFIMDRIFRKFGLSGKSFIPMLIGTGCGIPGVMASRTIENQRDRRMTIMTTTFIPCGAKLPIIALIAGALFGGAWWVAPSAYFVGIMAIVISGIILKKTKMFAGDPAPFVMELPAYHWPTAGNVLRSMWERGWSFIKKAGTIILVSSVAIWFLGGFGFTADGFGMVDMNESILAMIGNAIAWVFIPLGFGNWESAVATIMGLVAKENVVGTFGVLYGFGEEVAENGVEFWASMSTYFTAVSGYAFLVFNLLCAPCFAAIGAIKREMNNTKWTVFAITYQTVFAYAMALCVYQIGTLVTTGSFGLGTIAAFLVIALLVYLLVRRPYSEDKTTKGDKKLKVGA